MKEITLKWNEYESITIPISKAKRSYTKYQECRDLGSYYEYASFSGYYRIDKETKKVTLDTGVEIRNIPHVEVTIN
jgi:hypothetical protein